jgi:hypothetical protein
MYMMKDDVSHRGTRRKRNRRTRKTLKMKGGLSAQVNLGGVKEPTPTALTHASDALGHIANLGIFASTVTTAINPWSAQGSDPSFIGKTDRMQPVKSLIDTYLDSVPDSNWNNWDGTKAKQVRANRVRLRETLTTLYPKNAGKAVVDEIMQRVNDVVFNKTGMPRGDGDPVVASASAAAAAASASAATAATTAASVAATTAATTAASVAATTTASTAASASAPPQPNINPNVADSVSTRPIAKPVTSPAAVASPATLPVATLSQHKLEILNLTLPWGEIDDAISKGESVISVLTTPKVTERLFVGSTIKNANKDNIQEYADTYKTKYVTAHQDPGSNNGLTGGATKPEDSTVVTILPSPLLRDNSGSITDLILNGTLNQLYPMDPFFKPNAATCLINVSGNVTLEPELFSKGFGNKVIQPDGGTLTTLDFLKSSALFSDRLKQLPETPSLCYNMFFQLTDVPKNVAYMLMCISNNNFKRPGPSIEPVLSTYRKFWVEGAPGSWRYIDTNNPFASPQTLEDVEASLGKRNEKLEYVGTRDNCDLASIIELATSASAPIIPISCWTNGRTGFFDNMRFPSNVVACELFNSTQEKLMAEGKIFSDAVMNNIISILPKEYKNKIMFTRVDKSALSVPGMVDKIERQLQDAIDYYKSWMEGKIVGGEAWARQTLADAVIMYNDSIGELSERMNSLSHVSFLVPDTTETNKLEEVRRYYSDFFANVPVNAIENEIMPVYGSVSYLNATNLNDQINSPGYGGGSALMMWLMLGLTLFPTNPNRINEILQIGKLTSDSNVEFTVTNLEEELDSPDVVRNFTVIVLQAVCKELFAKAFAPEPLGEQATAKSHLSQAQAEAEIIGQGNNAVSDKRDSTRSVAEAFFNKKTYSPELAAKKRAALLKMNNYLLGKNLKVCRNATAISNEDSRTDLDLTYVPAETREVENYRVEKSWFGSRQKTDAQKQKSMSALSERGTPGLLGMRFDSIACLFNNDDDNDYDLVNYARTCTTIDGNECAPLTPRANFAFILSKMQTAYVKMKYRATLLNKLDKAEFVDDLGNYGINYLAKYFGTDNNGPSWLAKSGYRNVPPGGTSTAAAFNPKETVWVPTLQPGVGEHGNIHKIIRVASGSSTEEFEVTDADPELIKEVMLLGILKKLEEQGDVNAKPIYKDLVDMESGESFDHLRDEVKTFIIEMRNLSGSTEFTKATDLEKRQRDKDIKALEEEGFKVTKGPDGKVLFMPPEKVWKVIDPQIEPKDRTKMTYNEVELFVPVTQEQANIAKRLAETNPNDQSAQANLRMIIGRQDNQRLINESLAERTDSAEIIEPVIQKAKYAAIQKSSNKVREKVSDLEKESSKSIQDKNKYINALKELLTAYAREMRSAPETPDNRVEKENIADDKLDEVQSVQAAKKIVDARAKSKNPGKFYLEKVQPVLNAFIKAEESIEKAEPKDYQAKLLEAKAILSRMPTDADGTSDINALMRTMSFYTDELKEKDAYTESAKEDIFGKRVNDAAEGIYKEARSILQDRWKVGEPAGDDLATNLKDRERLINDIEELNNKFLGQHLGMQQDLKLRQEYDQEYATVNNKIDTVSNELDITKSETEVAAGKTWNNRKRDIKQQIIALKAAAPFPAKLQTKYESVLVDYDKWDKRQSAAKVASTAADKVQEDKKKEAIAKREAATAAALAATRGHEIGLAAAKHGNIRLGAAVPGAAVPRAAVPRAAVPGARYAAITPAAAGPVIAGPGGASEGGGDNDVMEAMRNEIAELKNKLQILQNGGVVDNELINKKVEEFQNLLNMMGGDGSLESAVTSLLDDLKKLITGNDSKSAVEVATRSRIMESLSSDIRGRESLSQSISDSINQMVASVVSHHDIYLLLETIRTDANKQMETKSAKDVEEELMIKYGSEVIVSKLTPEV